MEGQYNVNREFTIDAGDTILYRRSNFTNGIRALEKNGKPIQKYYGIWDYLALLIVITFIPGYFYLPRILKRLGKKHNEQLFKGYYQHKE